jgi:hypothetical protein
MAKFRWDPVSNPTMDWDEYVVRHPGVQNMDVLRDKFYGATNEAGGRDWQERQAIANAAKAAMKGPDSPLESFIQPVAPAKPLDMTFDKFRGLHKGVGNLDYLKAQYLQRQGRPTTSGQQSMLLAAAMGRARNATPANPKQGGTPAPAVASRTKPGTVPARTRGRRNNVQRQHG